MWDEVASTTAFPLPNGDPLGHRATTVKLRVAGQVHCTHQNVPTLGCTTRAGGADTSLRLPHGSAVRGRHFDRALL
jgi:hypothetical protein